MRNEPPLRLSPARVPPTDGWVGTHELPGFRAGRIVARLDDLPQVAPHHLYFDLLLLDAHGHTQDNHSGPCHGLPRTRPLDERSRFVRVVAELVRHAPCDRLGLGGIHQALALIRERGIETACLIVAAQLLDDVCSEAAVVASLSDVLAMSLGHEEARRTMSDVVSDLARNLDAGSLEAIDDINASGLAVQVAYVVRTVGKARARHYLRNITEFDLVPQADLLG